MIFKQFTLIFIISYIGEVFSSFIQFPIPGPIIGMLILLILLEGKILKLKSIEEASNFFLSNLSLFFIPSGVKLISTINILQGNLTKILIIMIFSTIITMGVTGRMVQFLINRGDK